MKKNLIPMTLAVASMILGSSYAETVLFSDNFDSYSIGQASNDGSYATSYNNTSSAVTIASGAGLGTNSGNVWDFTGDQQVTRTDTAIDLSNGAVTASIFFYYGGNIATANPQFGFVNDIGDAVNNGTNDLGGRLNSTRKLELRQNNSTLGTIGADLSGSLTSNNWYQLSVTIERSLTLNELDLSVSLFNANSAGDTALSQVGSTVFATATNAESYADNSLYLVTRESSFQNMDNFQVTQVPEPSSIFMVVMGFGLVGFMVRRRK